MFEPILVQVSNKFRDTKALKLFTKIKSDWKIMIEVALVV